MVNVFNAWTTLCRVMDTVYVGNWKIEEKKHVHCKENQWTVVNFSMATFEQKQLSQPLKTLSHWVEKVVPAGLKISALLPLST